MKSKTQQYVTRRLAGQSPEEAKRRSYLKQSGAWKAEQKYLEAAQRAKEAQIALEAQEKASYEQKLRDKDAATRDLATRQSRISALKESHRPRNWTEKRCSVCCSDYGCECAKKPATPHPLDSLPDAPVNPLPPRPQSAVALTLSDQILGRSIRQEILDERRSQETFVLTAPDGTTKTVGCYDPKYDREPQNPVFKYWEEQRNRSNSGERPAYESGTWTQATGFIPSEMKDLVSREFDGEFTQATGWQSYEQVAADRRAAQEQVRQERATLAKVGSISSLRTRR